MNNPYQTPDSELGANEEKSELASRWSRLGAVLIDSIIGMLIAVPFWLYTGVWETIQSGEQPGMMFILMASVYGFIGTVLVHGYFLHLNGQTIGKKMVGIRIANMEGEHPGLNRIVFRRLLPVSAVAIIPVLGNILMLIDALFIFSEKKRCVHDFIAGTQVLTA